VYTGRKRKPKGNERMTHKYVFSSWGKRERLGGVRLLQALLQREFIARLDQARSNELCEVLVGCLGGVCGETGDVSHFWD
jgi:hypothetical protein